MAMNSTNVRNSSWNLANILFYPAAFLAVTPFFINRLGENVFGEWMLINSYVYIAVHLVGFGLPVSITAHVAEAIGQGNNKKLHAYINAASRLLGRMSFLTILGGFVVYAAWQAGIGIFEDYTWKALVMATFLIAAKFPEILYQSIFKGQEFYNKAAIFNMLTRFITLGAQVLLVMKGYSLAAIFLSNLVIGALMLIPQAFLIYRKLPGYRPYLIKSLPEKKELYHYGFWTWLQTIIAIISYQLDRFLVAYFLGTATVTYYVLASTIVNHLHMAFEAVVSWLLPRVSRLQAATRDTRAYFSTIRAFSVGFSLLVIIGLYYISEPLFTLWLGPEKYLKMADFFMLFLIFEAFLILSIVPKFYLNAIKSLHFITLLELLYKSGIIIGMIIVFYFMETAESLIYGQILALIIFMPVEYYLVNKKVLKDNMFKETFLTSLPSLFIMGAILLSAWYWSVAALIAAIVIFLLVYLKDEYFDRKIFLE
jgi:O-antigen/teichoic acid export membrane protein